MKIKSLYSILRLFPKLRTPNPELRTLNPEYNPHYGDIISNYKFIKKITYWQYNFKYF
jgi:hypothetical protein